MRSSILCLIIVVAAPPAISINAQDIPTSFDWRSKGYVSPVTKTSAISSDAIEAILAAGEGKYAVESGNLTLLSRQQIIDCMNKPNSQVGDVYCYLTTNSYGLQSYATYPDAKTVGICAYNPGKTVGFYQGYLLLDNSTENDLTDLMWHYGQFVVQIETTDEFANYTGGIYKGATVCSAAAPNHPLVVVGYGSENGTDYWSLKNSWGTSWGEQGYVRIARDGANVCNENAFPTCPLFYPPT